MKTGKVIGFALFLVMAVLALLMRAWDSVALGWFYSGVLFVATVIGFFVAICQVRAAGSAARRKAALRLLAVFLCFSATGLLTAFAIQRTMQQPAHERIP